MKRIYTLLITILACSTAAVHADNETSYLPSIGIRQGGINKQGRTVRLTMDVDLSAARIRAQHTVALIPVLVSSDGTREAAFPPMVVDGRTRNNIYLRAQRLRSVELPPYHDDSAQAIIRRRNGKSQSYAYTAALPYERWMLDGRVELREEVHGCVNCGEGESGQLLWGGVLPAYIPQYRLDTIAPEPEPVKVRAETRTARLQFRQDSYRILPDYKNNRSELDTVSASIELVKKNADVSITGIYITGYASPEGSMAHNLTLSENRAKALADYIVRRDAIPDEMLHVDWKGEDWEGFVRTLDDHPDLLGRDRILELVARYSGEQDFCELQFQKLEPNDIYLRLLNEIYPMLRRNEYRIEYNVRNFNLDEARRMAEERPDLLSLQELYKVAGSYPQGSPDCNRTMRTAARYFPESPAVVNDLALEAMSHGDYAEAVATLEKAAVTNRTPVLLNTLGVAYAGHGEYRKAEEAFLRAAEGGSATARHNLSEVQSVIDQL